MRKYAIISFVFACLSLCLGIFFMCYQFDLSSSLTEKTNYASTSTTIQFDKNEGTGGTDSITVTQGQSMPTISVPSRTGYTFQGYYDSETDDTGNGTGTQYYTSSGTSARNWDGTSSTATLYACWEPITYNVSYNLNGGEWDVYAWFDSLEYDSGMFSTYMPKKAGYTFIGWTASNIDTTTARYAARVVSDGLIELDLWTNGNIIVSPIYVNGKELCAFNNLQSTQGATVTLIAHWTGNSYQVKFDGNGATDGSMTNQSFIYGSSQRLKTNAYEREGYTFLGWSTDKTATKASYTDGQLVSNLTTTKDDIVTLYAVWEANPYTLTFDPQGGTVSPSSISVTYGDTYGAHNGGVLPTPTRKGYTFLGWHVKTADDSERIATDKYDIAGDSTLYARWNDTWYNYGEKPSGSGTASNPYLISKSEHLGWLSYRVANGYDTNAYCKQTANINTIFDALVGSTYKYWWYPIGDKDHAFSGSYDGQGYHISYNIQGSNKVYYSGYSGMFGYCDGANLSNIYVYTAGFAYTQYSGAIAGYATNTTISNCAINFNNRITNINSSTLGAIVGYGTSSVTIKECAVFEGLPPTSDIELSGGSSKIQNCVYILDGKKGYTGTDFSNFTYIQGMLIPLPKGISWLAQGGKSATLAIVQAWAKS